MHFHVFLAYHSPVLGPSPTPTTPLLQIHDDVTDTTDMRPGALGFANDLLSDYSASLSIPQDSPQKRIPHLHDTCSSDYRHVLSAVPSPAHPKQATEATSQNSPNSPPHGSVGLFTSASSQALSPSPFAQAEHPLAEPVVAHGKEAERNRVVELESYNVGGTAPT